MSDITSYFNRYDRKSPAREAFLKSGEEKPAWLNHPSLEKVTAENYPKLYRAVTAECVFREIERPEFYVDKGGDSRLGAAYEDLYTVLVESDAYEVFDENELRALVSHEIKHLYQGEAKNSKETRLNELDADRAAVQSTNYKTIQSYIHKAIALEIVRGGVPKPFVKLAQSFHETFSNLISQNAWVSFRMDPYPRLDREHDSSARRMREMWKCEKSLQNSHEKGGLIHLNLDQ
ncbi:MAG: hypothetical protein ACT4OY_06665 [Alphaproteobacteria bacterium]